MRQDPLAPGGRWLREQHGCQSLPLLRGVDRVRSVQGGTAQAQVLGTRIVPEMGVGTLVVRL